MTVVVSDLGLLSVSWQNFYGKAHVWFAYTLHFHSNIFFLFYTITGRSTTIMANIRLESETNAAAVNMQNAK